MNFERGKDIRDSMKIGQYAEPIIVEDIFQLSPMDGGRWFNSTKFVLNATECVLFMDAAVDGFNNPRMPGEKIPNPDAHVLKIRYNRKSREITEVSIRELEGRVIKLREWEKLYKVNKVVVINEV